MKSIKLLLIDDDARFILAMQKLLRMRGIDVEVIPVAKHTGTPAIRDAVGNMLASFRPDAIGMDIRLDDEGSPFDESGIAIAAAASDCYKFWLTVNAVSPLPELKNKAPFSSIPIVNKVKSRRSDEDTAEAIIIHLKSIGLATEENGQIHRNQRFS